jgi:small subunit ribosomal protein S17
MEENIENNDSVSGSEEESRSDAINEATDKALAGSATETTSTTAGAPPRHRRQEKIGLVTSDKMQKTVVVRVERQVKHRKYKRYIRRRTKFMAHDEVGAHTGDIVRIVETRPLSARKRWRVVEIVQKAR